MNIKRFVARTAREALSQARAAWGEHAVVLSNREIPGGVEIVAMADGQASLARHDIASNPDPDDAPSRHGGALANADAPLLPRRTSRATAVLPDEPMSTVSFEQFVRERQRRHVPQEPGRFAAEELHRASLAVPAPAPAPAPAPEPQPSLPPLPEVACEPPPAFREARPAQAAAPAPGHLEVLRELRSLRDTLGVQLAGIGWFDQVRRQPVHTRLLRSLLDAGWSPGLARYLVDKLPAGHDEEAAREWLSQVLQQNLHGADTPAISLALTGGHFAVVGPAGSGKTRACVRLACAHATLHGPGSVGIVCLDLWPASGGDSLRAHARAHGLPVHAAHDGQALADLLSLLASRSLVLVDTPGLPAQDPRGEVLRESLPASLEPLLVLPANLQAESLDAAVRAWVPSTPPAPDYPAGRPARCIFTRLDETPRLGPVIDLLLRRKLRLEALLEEDPQAPFWPAIDTPALVARALAPRSHDLFCLPEEDLGLVMTPPAPRSGALPIVH